MAGAARLAREARVAGKTCIKNGRGGKTRTRDTWFWRPVLYQLSYTPVNVYVIFYHIFRYFLWKN